MNLIKSPLLTEKAALGLDRGLYIMKIDRNATKKSVAEELKRMFKLDAVSVRIVNRVARQIKFKRIPGVQRASRKAYIQLKAGQRLTGFELPKQKAETKQLPKNQNDRDEK